MKIEIGTLPMSSSALIVLKSAQCRGMALYGAMEVILSTSPTNFST